MTQLNVITTAVQIRVGDTGWGCNSKKKKKKKEKYKDKTLLCKRNGKNVTQKGLLFCFLGERRTILLLSPVDAELNTRRGTDISVPLLIQMLHLYTEKENQSWLMITPKHTYFFNEKMNYTEVFKKNPNSSLLKSENTTPSWKQAVPKICFGWVELTVHIAINSNQL